MKQQFVFVISFIIVMLTTSLAAVESHSFAVSNNQSGAKLLSSSDYECTVLFSLSDITSTTIQTKGGTFDEISADNYGFTNRVGKPKLPVLSRIIAVPVGAAVSFDILAEKHIVINKSISKIMNKIIPAQRSVSKSEDPANVKFTMDESIYNNDKYTDNELFSVSEIGFMRGVRLFRVEYEPMRYNPVTGDLQVSYDVQVRINFEHPDIIATRDLLAKTASYEFEQVYSKTIFNWNNNSRDVLTRYPTKILILTPANYVTTLQPFVDWKKQQGYTVVVTTVGTGGTVTNTSAAIKTYMSTVWSAATAQDPAPSYLLIVGDTSTSGDNITATSATVSSPSSSHITDNYYARLNGTDYIPEMYTGRFSVSSATELTNIINKTLQYEKTTMPDLSYLGNVILMAGVDATHATTYGNGQINYGTTQYFNSTNGITSNTYLYPASNGSVESEIIGYMSAGRGFINYTAHGSETSWADPTVSTTDVAGLTNTNKPFVAVGNCCVTNAFNYSSPCFGESLIRGANKGAAAYIGATNNSYWDEDYWWGIGYKTPIQEAAHSYSATTLGAYDAMFHTHSEAVADWAQTVGETNYMGLLAVEQSTSTYKPYYWEIYSIMGDPSLMPYYGVPTTNTVSFPSTIFIGATSVTVSAAPQSRVAVSMGGVLYGTGIVDATGTINLTITPFTSAGTADIVITRQNKITRISTITVAPNSGPYVTLDSWSYADSNNNSPESGEAGRINVTFKNIGNSTATSVTCTLSSTNAGISFTDNAETVATLASGASVTVNNAYSFNIVNNMADQTQPPFSLAMVSGANTWNGSFNLTVNAPALSFGSITISDPTGNNNGKIDPGETVTVTIPLQNSGHATSASGSGTLTCSTSGITINTGTSSFSAISASGSATLTFNLTASSGMATGSSASLVFNATAGAYSASKTESADVGAPTVLTIGTGTSTQTYPIDRYYNYSSHESIYLASEINTAGTIRTIGFYKSSGSDTGTIDAVTIYMKNTTDATLATGTYSTTGYTQVYSGTFTNTATSGWMDVTLTTPFSYNGTSNLGILIIKGNQTYIDSGYPYWAYSTSSTYRARQAHSDSAQPTSLTYTTYLPNLKLGVNITGFNPPLNLAGTGSNSMVVLTWQAPVGNMASSYKIYRNSSLLTTVTGLTYNDTAVTNGTTYSYYLKAVYTSPTAGESSATTTINVTPNIYPPQNLVGTPGNTTVALSWQAPVSGTPTGYKVYKNSTYLATTASLSYTDNAVVNGTSYSYYITATYTSPTGESTASNTVSVTPSSNITVTIGTGTSTQRQPFGMYFGYERDAALYLSSEIGSFGTIQTLSWYVSTSQTASAPVTIRMMTTTSTALTSSTWATMISSATTVYTSTGLSFSTTGWKTLTLTSPFTYASGNLIVLIETTYGASGVSSYPYFRYTTAATGSHQYWYQDSSAPTGSGTLNTSRPNIQLAISTVPTTPVFSVNTTAISFGNVAVGSTSNQSFILTNTGIGTLSGSITTPAGFTVATAKINGDVSQSRASNSRDVLAYSLTAGQSRTYNLTFTPTLAQSYNGNVTITSNDSNHASNTITLTATGYVSPSATLNLTTLDVSVLSGDSQDSGFTICNTGTVNLTYSTTNQNHASWLSCNPASGTVVPSACYPVTVTLNATGLSAGTYSDVIILTSNDPLHPSQNISVTARVTVGNHAPVINLPESVSFDKNQVHIENFASYITDADNDPITLTYEANRNIDVQINGLQATFSPSANWFGTTQLTFTASDGQASNSDIVTINVLATDTPTWTPVVYPNNPATVYGIITIDGLAVTTNDQVSAFVGSECRGTGAIVLNSGNAYTTMLVNLASSGETVSFKVYDVSADLIYTASPIQSLTFGQVLGDTTPYPISIQTAISLEAPVITIIPNESGLRVSWQPVPNADRYRVITKTEVDAPDSLVYEVSTTYYDEVVTAVKKFFRVIAIRDEATRGGGK